ncbi:MFS transporter [Thalassotalea insulae]|uniref:MFS transporter n=1 Tax=Thalassotalea insulae TaxID=2056778 RepID=A0ABQ6GPD9_9GAMM|nr:MFS transporter [Thalassotalea insulae]GLX77019.1 MFS transporter [Thalassotalea insulae]
MSSSISFKSIKQFPPLMWVILFGDFITRGSYYMVWPFLAVILYQKFALSATEVGAILSGAAVLSVFVGFFGGAISDTFGRKRVMFSSGIIYVLSFVLLSQVDSVVGYIVVITCCSMSKAVWDPPTQALVSDILPDLNVRELALQGRYFVINVGCAIGPIIGVYYGVTGQQSTFLLTAGAFALWLALLAVALNKHGEIAKHKHQKEQKLSATWRVLWQDKMLQCLIVANLVCLFVYAQMDSTLIQYLTRADVPELMTLISSLILTNAVVIVSSQFILLKLLASLSLTQRIKVGLVLLACSQVWMSINPVDEFWGWIAAIAVMSVAEAILFPTMNVQIDRLAPSHLKGAYFGAASFYSVGYAIAPFGGGIILDILGGPWVFAIGTVLIVGVYYLYSILHRMPRPDFELLPAEKS